MINIREFKVDKIVLLITIIRRMKLTKFEKDPRFFKIIQVARRFTNNPDLYKLIIEDSVLMNELSLILESDTFQKLYNDALVYRDEVAQRWEAVSSTIEEYYTNVLGLTEEKEIVANIGNPKFNTGTNNMNNEIFFAHMKGKKDISYDATYIMHEALHCLFPREKSWTEEEYGINHSLIELATDNELRARLGGNNKNYTIGHPDGAMARKALMPLWVTFMSEKGGCSQYTIPKEEKFQKHMNIARDNNVHNMNYKELMQYCIEHYRDYGLTKDTFYSKKKPIEVANGDEI